MSESVSEATVVSNRFSRGLLEAEAKSCHACQADDIGQWDQRGEKNKGKADAVGEKTDGESNQKLPKRLALKTLADFSMEYSFRLAGVNCSQAQFFVEHFEQSFLCTGFHLIWSPMCR